MKNKAKFAGILTIAAFIGFTLISCEDLFNIRTIATPEANPPAGTFSSAQGIALSSETSGANIFYTVDGSTPTTGSPRYFAPITISGTTTLKAIAVKSGNVSEILTADYTINSLRLESIDITTPPTKTVYAIDESLDTTGMVVTATLSNGSTAVITTGYTTDFDSSAAGSKTVTVTYGGQTATFTITVQGGTPSKTVTSIAVTPPTKTVYAIGESLNKAGMVVTATYSDSSTEVITTGYTMSVFDSTMVGSKDITVTYGGQTANFTVTVEEGSTPSKTVTSIAVTPPTKTVYAIGESLNTADMVVTATYSDGSTAAVTGYETSGFSSTTAGQKNVTVTYEGKTATFTITVEEGSTPTKTLTSIDVTTQPAKTVYYVGDSFDPAGMVVTATYSDSSTAVIPSGDGTNGYNITGFDSSAVGSKTVTVTYNGETATFTVTINAVTLTGINITAQPTKTVYYVGDSFDPAGMVVTATYNNGTTATVSNYTTDFDSSAVGSKTVTVTYNGETATFTVTINAVTLTGINITAQPTKTVYYVGDSFDPAGMVVTATYSDGSTEVITTGYTTSGFDSTMVGEKPITVTYEGKTATFTVTVIASSSGPVTPPPIGVGGVLDPATTNTPLSNSSFTPIVPPHKGGNNWLVQSASLGYETWDDDGGDNTGIAKFIWYGANQGGGAAFRAEWGKSPETDAKDRPKDFLARVGYFWNTGNPHTFYKNIYCGFNFDKSGQYRGNFSYIGIYGWSKSPTVEYYIVENSYGNAWNDHAGYIARLNEDTLKGDEMESYTLDGSEYKVYKVSRTGPSINSTNESFTQFFSIRQTARTNGTISVTEHFKKWAERGMNLGSNMYECKFKVEVGGRATNGSASTEGYFDARLIQFYRAENDGTIIEITP